MVEDEDPHQPGKAIAEGIVLQRRLWEGDTADVWLARHDGLAEDVAVKILHEEAWRQTAVRRRHAKETETARAVTHPHATSILEEGSTGAGVPYVVVEILSGLSLKEIVEELGALPADEVVELVSQVGAALSHAHAQGVVHGELTWESVMMVEGPDRLFAKVANFGDAGDDTVGGAARRRRLQSPVFFAPERLAGGGPVDLHADLWALSVMAFWALVGKPPYPARSLPVYLRTMREEPSPPRASERRVGLPRAADAVFERALGCDPEGRFPSAEAFVAALREALAGVEVDPSRPSPLSRATVAREDVPPESSPRSSRSPRSVSPRTYVGETLHDKDEDTLPSERSFVSLEDEPHYEAGMRVAPHLELRAPLGQGTMGEVWRAHDEKRGEDVAVKLVAREVWRQRHIRMRFHREAGLAQKVDHPHVVAVLEQGRTTQDLPYLSMELIVGPSLEERLLEGGPLSLGATVRLVGQLAGVLSVLHDVDMIHRDVKPANILIVEDGEELVVKLADFGIAKATGPDETSLTATGVLLGTPFYMNPEQLLGGVEADAMSDLWALAVVGYYALTGRRPFQAENITKLMMAMRVGAFPSPGEIVPTLPPTVDAFFARALASTREERFPTAEALADAMAAAAGGEHDGDAASNAQSDAKGASLASPSPAPWAWIALAFVVALALAWLATR